ncbi:MAG TPA: response regulator [Candidatus Binataceae bacterium]|nr:response regulator [Candidatus Binataceae bacterium]
MLETILIIDDETDMADTCARVLGGLGFKCLVVYDSAKALALIDSERPALIISDITMPTKDGFEIARYVRQKSPEIPVVLMTAYHTPDIARNAQVAGAKAYLRKPFPNAELILTVKTLLGRDGKD